MKQDLFGVVRRRVLLALLLVCPCVTGCKERRTEPGSVVVIIESSPNNLDLRVGADAQSERVGGLIFDALAKKDEHYELQPWLAKSWEQPDPLTWVFHLRDGVRFHDGRPLEAEDVAYTIRSLIDGSLVTAKGGGFNAVDKVEAKDRLTVVVHMKRPEAGLLFNVSDGLFGVVPRGSGRDFGLHPVGSGPFRFVSAVQDKEVVVARNHEYWAGMPVAPAGAQDIERVRFEVVPDAITSALELKKGSADLASNVVTLDMVHALESVPNLKVESGTGSPVVYVTFNVTDPLLKDMRVRQAIACAMDRQAIVDAIWRGQARLADTLLPEGHWAAASDAELAQVANYPHDVARAQRLLDEAGFPAGKDGVRLRLTMKTSTDETTRLMVTVLQQQLRAAGIRLEIRSAEFGTFYADVTKGAFQMYALRWIGSNEDPDIFRYAYASTSFPPKGGNRGRYSNARVDGLLKEAAASSDRAARRGAYVEVQKILAEELPGIPMWYPNNEVIHTRRVEGVVPRGAGSFDFLTDAWIR
ncbi:ABC transporter substrate-binding protein [Tunturiibacter empetritectus]|uniref:Peptide/nickel transport system substrate-binding protein n=1 Tax=Tunturiibacter lichenicola TaxID=2051959 RepID=A0A852VF41_9BACT|nr:ABC transporter substrate-binding protein [Edaphobacter lichenicola]NYF89861.1 peptide/nickel transport system substrate-binding protein [Edaphobacter lichenicola]